MVDISLLSKPAITFVSWICLKLVGGLSISIIGPSNVTYYRTPDIDDNKNIFYSNKKHSYSKFRIMLQIYASYSIVIHAVRVYAFNRNEGEGYKERWVELIHPDTPIQETSVRKVLQFNEHPSIGSVDTVFKGTQDGCVNIDNGSKVVLIEKIGMFRSSFYDDERVIRDRKYCDILIIFDINSSSIGMLCALPEFYNDYECEPVIMSSRVFGGHERIKDVVNWAALYRPSEHNITSFTHRTERFNLKVV